MLLGEQAAHHLAGVGGTGLLGGQEVDGHNDAHQQVTHKAHHTEHAAGDDGHQRGGLGQHLLGDPVHEAVVGQVQLLGHPVLQRRIRLQQVGHPAADGVVIGLDVGKQLGNALIQLRQQHGGQQIQHHNDNGPGQQDAQGPKSPGGPLSLFDLLSLGQEQLFKIIDHRRQQVGHEGTVQHRRQGGKELPAKGLQHPAAEKGVIKQQNGTDREKHRQSQLHMPVFPLHVDTTLSIFSFYTATRGIAILIFP